MMKNNGGGTLGYVLMVVLQVITILLVMSLIGGRVTQDCSGSIEGLIPANYVELTK